MVDNADVSKSKKFSILQTVKTQFPNVGFYLTFHGKLVNKNDLFRYIHNNRTLILYGQLLGGMESDLREPRIREFFETGWS
jgi:hypothetical protein